jgi:exodeoxyribonuclease V beta subunit
MKAFDVCGPLPSGVTVLEASAGTGKTFTIAALATRYVAEAGVPLEHLLLVTFTRMATGELRQRVRERMVSAEAGLRRVLAGDPVDGDDDVLALLADAPADEVARRRERLRAALAGFDGATIDTTHAFCQRVLHGMGVIADMDRDATFQEESIDLVEEVVTDFYLRKFARGTGRTDFSLDEARRMARRVVANPDAALYPPATGNPRADLRRAFAERVRDEVERRRRRSGLLTFDDLLTRLRDTLRADDDRGAAACARLRERYRVALVDEFQDTDPIQWEILRRAFVDDDPDATLVLIGDPKQAIYAFRGADVYAYLDAAATAGTRATLEVNWRSDQPLLHAFDALFAGAQLGHEGIVYRDVRAADGHEASRLAGAPVDAPLRIRMLHRDSGLVKLTPKAQAVGAAGARAVIADDVARDAVALLASGAVVDGRPVRPGDLAVLVARNADAFAVRDALDAAGVPAVVNGAGSVFTTPAARDWLRLLEALERPSSTNAVRAAALTSFLGWTAEQVATAGDEAWEDVHARLHRWAGVLRRRGVAALFETISQRERLAARLLARAQGERVLTDLRHLAQLLHRVVTVEQLGLTALVAWLHTRMDDVTDETDAEERSRRLESDADAVQVLTIYRSKGLEFPVVYLPYLWHPGYVDENDPPVFHDAANGDARTIDVSGDPASDAIPAQLREVRGEELRLAYVALTRARHQAVVWWTATWASRESSLGRLLFARDEATGRVATSMQYPVEDAVAVAAFADLAARAPVSLEEVEGGPVPVWAGAATTAPTGGLDARRFERDLDPRWRRTSYSSITEAAHEVRVASEPEAALVTDEGLAVVSMPGPAAADSALRAIGLPLGGMRAGADVGTFVHGMFERADFAAADLDAELAAAYRDETARELVHLGDPAEVLAGLRAAIETPLGPLVGGLRLRDLGRRDRVDELSFELPLVGGDDPTGVLTVTAIGDLLDAHLAAGDPLRPYAERLRDPVLAAELRGYLTGSLDLTLRTPDGRYAVVDYKTNRLGRSDEELTAWHYRPEAVIDAMFGAHYPLQALLYTVALHRYLRWRLAGYAPERHLAGVLYLFVRGMIGAATPVVGGQPCGVFSWAPPPALVEALSDLFDRGVRSEDAA